MATASSSSPLVRLSDAALKTDCRTPVAPPSVPSMSVTIQAIINGVRADARGTGWDSPQLVVRPRGRGKALALQDV
ncbi:hypothetical protein K378_00951 [Streptomyces sp. Amel2xB2]|nr:hypothetical protein K378_00951 [Streptomyces sp. Amel2xB2]